MAPLRTRTKTLTFQLSRSSAKVSFFVLRSEFEGPSRHKESHLSPDIERDTLLKVRTIVQLALENPVTAAPRGNRSKRLPKGEGDCALCSW